MMRWAEKTTAPASQLRQSTPLCVDVQVCPFRVTGEHSKAPMRPTAELRGPPLISSYNSDSVLDVSFTLRFVFHCFCCNSVSSVQLLSRVQLFATHGQQHSKLPCSSPSPRVCSNSCPLVGDAIQPSHPLSSPSAFNLSQHQVLFQCVGSSHQVAKVLELQLQHQSFQ